MATITNTREQRIADYNRQLDALIKAADELEDGTVKKSIAMLKDAEKRIEQEVINTEWDAYRNREMRLAIREEIKNLENKLQPLQNQALEESADLGEAIATTNIQAGGVDVALAQTGFSARNLAILQDYSADLITNVVEETIKKVNSEVQLGLLGEKTPFQVMEALKGTVKDKGVFPSIEARIEAIVRTEMARVQNNAAQARYEAFAKANPDKKMYKKWLHSGNLHWPRRNHLALHNKIVPFEKNFPNPGGVPIPYPQAPGLPAKEVVRCRCRHIIRFEDQIDKEALAA